MPGTTRGGGQKRRRPEWLVRLGQEDGVPVWQGQADQGEKTDQVEKRAKVEEMDQVQVEKRAKGEKMDQATQLGKPEAADKWTQAESHEFPADRVPEYKRWSTKA